MTMYVLCFVAYNGEESYWYEHFDDLLTAVKAAFEFGIDEELFHVYDENHKLVFTGRL